jgi:hypothetical protein
MSVSIDKGVPIPGAHRAGGRQPKYPWREMEVGDSFFVPKPEGKDLRQLMARLASQACYYKPLIFTTRGVDGGVRVWRTS